MVSQIFDEFSKEVRLINLDNEPQSQKQINNVGKVQMKKQLGLLESVAIILGIICGSGKYFLSFLILAFIKHIYNLHILHKVLL